MKEYTGNLYVHEMMKAMKKKRKTMTTCQRAESGGEPVFFMSEDAFRRFCDKSSGKKRGRKKMDMGIRHAVHDDCRFCPFAGGKNGMPENIRFMELAA